MRRKTLLLAIFLGLCITGICHPSVSIIMDSKGNVYYSDLAQVWKIDLLGKKTIVVPNVHTHELYLDAEDNLYGEHLWYNGDASKTWGYYVWRLSPAGKLEKIIPNTEGFLSNYSFVRDQQGQMYWPDRTTDCQKVIRISPDGTKTAIGNQCFTNIRWMSVTRDGILYLTDFHDLKKIDADGQVTTVAKDLSDKKLTVPFVQENHYLGGLTSDKFKNVYVADYSGRQVKKITPAGEVTVAIQTKIPWSPAGTLVAPNGDFWVLECSITNAVRVEKITTDGKRTIY